MKKTTLNLLVLVSAICLVFLSSCRFNSVRGSGNMITETRKVSDFTKIEISGNYKVNLKQDSSASLTITADDNLLKYIKTEVNGDKLRIYNRKNIRSHGDLVINVGIKTLKNIEASGAVEVASDGKLILQDLHFNLSGATKINMELNAANVTTESSGVAKVMLKGQASSHNIDMSGAGKISAFDFVVGNCNIESSGVSKCEINVLNSLNIHSSGASTIRYRGNPKNVSNDKSGASSVEKVD